MREMRAIRFIGKLFRISMSIGERFIDPNVRKLLSYKPSIDQIQRKQRGWSLNNTLGLCRCCCIILLLLFLLLLSKFWIDFCFYWLVLEHSSFSHINHDQGQRQINSIQLTFFPFHTEWVIVLNITNGLTSHLWMNDQWPSWSIPTERRYLWFLLFSSPFSWHLTQSFLSEPMSYE